MRSKRPVSRPSNGRPHKKRSWESAPAIPLAGQLVGRAGKDDRPLLQRLAAGVDERASALIATMITLSIAQLIFASPGEGLR